MYHQKFLGIRFLKDFSLTTMSNTVKGGRNHPVAIVQEQMVLVREPSSQYLGHISPANGKSISLISSNPDKSV